MKNKNIIKKGIEDIDPLHVNKKQKSYIIPIVQIIISVAVIAFSISWNSFINVDNEKIEALLTFAGLIASFVSAYIICVALGEMGFVSENRAKAAFLRSDIANFKSKAHPTDEILQMLKDSKDIEILSILDGRLAYIGTKTSYSKAAGFFNKRYFINDDDYAGLDEFKNELFDIPGTNEIINVISIDGKNEVE